MDVKRLTHGLSALSTPSRLEVLRVLAQAGADGMPSGEVAKTLNVPQNTLSTQLSVLANADLVESERKGRFIIYRVKESSLRELLDFFESDLRLRKSGGSRPGRRSAAA